jgi:hypothetical protein
MQKLSWPDSNKDKRKKLTSSVTAAQWTGVKMMCERNQSGQQKEPGKLNGPGNRQCEGPNPWLSFSLVYYTGEEES